MIQPYDAIVVGAGHNGLTTAAYLAKADKRVLVLERRDIVGGVTVTQEVHTGFKFDTWVHGVGWLHPKVMRDLDLAHHGLEILRNDPTVFAPLPDGAHLTLWQDGGKTVETLRGFSSSDANKWGAFAERVAQVAQILEAAYSVTPPDIRAGSFDDLVKILKLGGRLRRLGRRNMMEVIRLLPMSVAEFLDEWFETDVLKGTLGASGIGGIFQGPRASGTTFILAHHHVGSPKGVFRSLGLVRGGVGNLSAALAGAARQHGAEIRTGAEVEQVVIVEGQARGVVLASGEEIAASQIISNADPHATFLGLVGPLNLPQDFVQKVRNIKFRGACARVNLALDELPSFTSLPGDGPHLRGVISISPSLNYLERAYDDAKYGGISQQPCLEASIPSLADPTLAPSGKHVMTIAVQYAPYQLKQGVWDDAQRELLFDTVVETLTEYAPNLTGAILHSQVLTPLDLEQEFGLTEGNLNHGELTLDQLFFMRPVPGWAQYRTPIKNLYLCGAGTHPGGGVAAASGYNAAREILKDA